MYNVGIIGLGNIAGMYGKPGDAAPYCHVGGICLGQSVRVTALADLLEHKREAFRERWASGLPGDVRYYESSTAMLAAETFDIVAVCVRGPDHFAVTMETIEAGPRAIFLEKPPTCSLQELDVLMAAAGEKGIPVTVSYSRHWAPHVLRLQELVEGGLIGEVTKVVGYCGGTFLSFASHTMDLICQFAGYCPTAVYARGRLGDQSAPGYEPEPSLEAVVIEFANGVTGVHVGDRGERGTFYADVHGTEGRVQAGIYIPPAAWDKDGKPVDLQALGMPANASVFTVAYEQIAAHLNGGPLPHCTNDHVVTVHEMGFAGIESVHTDRRVEIAALSRTRKVFANG